MSKEATFPDWAKTGADVLLIRSRYGSEEAVAGKIQRLTKTRIVVDVDRGARQYESQFVASKFGDGRWVEYGKSDSWSMPFRLTPVSSEEAQGALKELRSRSVLAKAVSACDRFGTKRTVESASEAIEALRTFIEGNKP